MSTVSSGKLIAHFISGRRATPSGQRIIDVTSPPDGALAMEDRSPLGNTASIIPSTAALRPYPNKSSWNHSTD